MKICMVAYAHYESDGRLHRYSQSLLKRGHQVDVIGFSHHGEPFHGDADGVQIYRVLKREFNEKRPFTYLMRMLLFFVNSSFWLTLKHFKQKYDVIHYHNIPDFGIFCTLIPKILGAKVILDLHDLVPEFYMRKFDAHDTAFSIKLLKWIEKISCAYADHVITVTDIWRTTLGIRSVSPDKCSVIMNLPISDIFQPLPYQETKPGSPFLITYHGNLAEQTGVDNLIKAIDQVRKKIPTVRLQIIGSGNAEDFLKKLTTSLDLESHVTIKPIIPVTDIPGEVKNAHLAVDPKRDGVYAGETLSVKSMEYLAMKIPLIVSKTCATAYYFDENVVRFVVPDQVDMLVEAIIALYEHPEQRKKLHQQSDQFNKKYNWNNEQEKYIEILKNLV